MIFSAAESPFLKAPVNSLRGISSKRAAALKRLGISTLADLLYHLPRAYEDWSEITPISELVAGQPQTIKAEIAQIGPLKSKGRLKWWQIELADSSGSISCTYFNQPWLRNKLLKGESFYFHAKPETRGFFINLLNPDFRSPEEWAKQNIFPIYPLTEGISQKVLRQLISNLLKEEDQIRGIVDPLPKKLRSKYKLADLSYALARIHEPRNAEDLAVARRRISFAELFLTGAALKLLRERRLSQERAVEINLDQAAKKKFTALIDALPFKPTESQIRASNEIFSDLRKTIPMSRLLQGDVGSGKTLVALLAMYYVVLAGYQASLMAPTSILAQQHYEKLEEFLAGTGVRLGLLTGGLKLSERRELKDKLLQGEIDILIGTHAVISDDIQMPKLALAVTDEQHRFGVRQRAKAVATEPELEGRSFRPHSLVMSATPIPRTLALILYGDLDLSILDEKPAGRGELLTYTARTADLARVNALIENEIKSGRQAYIVCPLLSESEDYEAEAAEEVYNELSRKDFRNYRLALLHGGMKTEEKAQILLSFLNRKLDILVSTTVIEVGIDNPNATIMLIRNAERFGLAQIHQLRGRIGRGQHRSLCILHSDVKEGLARERLRTLCREDDGFKIAEADLQLRGPGQFFGTRQHGINEFKLAYAYADKELMQEVEEALENESLTDPNLRRALEQRFPELEHGETL